jgi:hypothetical protein
MKGFMFSLDSFISIGLIILAATTIWSTISEKSGTETISVGLQNAEIMTLYFNEPAKENVPASQNQKCEELNYYDSNITKITTIQTMSKKTICEGI